MSKENKLTVEIYNQQANTYLKTTLLHEEKDPQKAKVKKEKLERFFKESLKSIGNNEKVFEVGSADGENAKYIQSLGYNVTASDIADDFLKAIKAQGLNATKFNLIEDNFKDTYSAVICWRVFVHFTLDDFSKSIKKIYNALNTGGILIFNVMNRACRKVDSEWVDFDNEYHMGAERYYNYFDKNDVDQIISSVGFKVNNHFENGGDNNNKWLVYVLQK